MKILLINPSSSAPENKRENMMGIPYLMSSLSSAGYKNQRVLNFFNMPWSLTEDLTKKELLNYKPDAVLISCFTINHTAGVKSAILAKKISPAANIVMGGMHPSFLYEQILTHYPVDSVCVGEGEETVVELMRAHEKNSSLDAIKGIAFKRGHEIIFTGKREFIKNIDNIAFPAHDIYKDDIKSRKSAQVITSRGCPFGCQFCATTEFWGRSWRGRSAKNVVDEIEKLIKDYGVNFINFLDDEFTLQKKRTIELCKEMIARGINIRWSCSTRVNSIDREQLELMKQAGCVHIAMGIESGSPKILKSIGKKITVEEIVNGFELIKEFGITRGSFLMVGNPGENRDSINDTIKLIKRLKLDILPPAVAEVYPGTQLYDISKKSGFISDDYWLTDNLPPLFTVEHSAERLKWWAFLIGLASKRLHGNLKAAVYLVRFAITKRQKIARFVKRAFKGVIGIKDKYVHKEY